jgi:hypothetical protein
MSQQASVEQGVVDVEDSASRQVSRRVLTDTVVRTQNHTDRPREVLYDLLAGREGWCCH